jgi:hypothetical protein
MESSKGEQASVVFLGRDTFRMQVVPEAVEEVGAIPTARSEGQTGRIFDRRRVARTAAPPASPLDARSRRLPLVTLFTTFAAGMFVAAAILVVRTRPVAVDAAPPPPAPPAPAAITIAPVAPAPAPAAAPIDEPTPAIAAAPPRAPAPAGRPPADEPTPASMAPGPAVDARVEAPATPSETRRRVGPGRPSRPAPARRIVPPTRPWVDPFAS